VTCDDGWFRTAASSSTSSCTACATSQDISKNCPVGTHFKAEKACGYVDDADSCAPGPAVVDLGTAFEFVILSKSGISTVPDSVITGDIGVSPIAATGVTGFSLTLDAGGEFSTSAQVGEC
jgi:hypothetical protein